MTSCDRIQHFNHSKHQTNGANRDQNERRTRSAERSSTIDIPTRRTNRLHLQSHRRELAKQSVRRFRLVAISHSDDSSSRWLLEGVYRRFNLNMPTTLPHRKDGFRAYDVDSPLTEIGYLQAKLSGRALKEANIHPTYAYCSPAYRCVQTCVGIIRGKPSIASFLRTKFIRKVWATST